MTRYSKFIAAALAFVGVIVASGLLHGQAQAQAWASGLVSAAGAALVYLLPNEPMPTGKRAERGHVDLLAVALLVFLVLACLVLLGLLPLHLR